MTLNQRKVLRSVRDYDNRPSRRKSAAGAAICLIAMVGLAVWLGIAGLWSRVMG